jgi:ATP-binding cassette subfamily B protein
MMSGFHLPYIGANLSLGMAATLKTATYLLLSYFVDNILGIPENRHLLPLVGLGFILVASFEGIFTYLSGRLAAYTAEGVVRRLRNYLFDHIQRLSFAYHSRTQTGELIQRSTSDVDALRRFFAEQAIGIGRIMLLFVINFLAIFNISPKLAWISIISLPFIFAASIFFFRRISKAYEAYQEQEATLSTTLQENLSGVRVVKAFARQPYEIEKFEKENWKKFTRGRNLMKMQSFFWPLTDIICSFQMLGGFITGSLMVIDGQLTIGSYLAYVGLVVWLIWPIRNLGRLIVQTSTGMVSLGRVMDIIREDREPLDKGDFRPQGEVKGDLLFSNVFFQYDDDPAMALKDISFHCKPGQVIALLGSTGSGKTTLVNLLPRFHNYTSGSILLDGVELRRYPRKFLRSQIGIVEQEPFLFSRNIRENITYGVGRDVPEEEVIQAAKAAAIHDVILSFPDGYNTLVGEKGVTLSGGQKQRVAIARTLLKNPRILILDDSTSSVDTETEAEIRQALVALMQDRTSFVIAHRIQSVMQADLILVMDKGEIVQAGVHDDLVNQEGIYRQIYEIQTRIENELEKEIDQNKLTGETSRLAAAEDFDELPVSGTQPA